MSHCLPGFCFPQSNCLAPPQFGSACACACVRVHGRARAFGPVCTRMHVPVCILLSLPPLHPSHERGPVRSQTWLLQGASDMLPAFFCPDYYFDHRHQHHRHRGSPSSGPPSLLGSRFLLEFAFLPLFYFILFLLTETRARPSSQSQDLLQTSR